jgi:hypothetical protein
MSGLLRVVAGIAALALTASLVACDTNAEPSASSVPDLIAVVTGDNVNALVGINVASRTVTRLAVVERNEAQDHGNWGIFSTPPLSVVLSDPTGSNDLVWTQVRGLDTVAVRDLDRATGEVSDVDAPARGVLPFLYEGKLAWASAPGDGQSRLLISDGTFELDLPGVPSAIVAGPGPGRITALLEVANGRDGQRIVVVDVAGNEATDLPAERLRFGGIWADDRTLVASVYSRVVPTPADPENGEPDNRLLTWSIDAGSSPEAVAGLVAGESLRTDFYPELLVGGDGLVVAVTGSFDHPRVEVHSLDSTDPVQIYELLPAEWLTAMSVSRTTVVVLQSRHVTFIDLSSGNQIAVEIGGVTDTRWVGP